MKKIIETLRLKWTEYLIEVFVITLGILGAYLLDDWNENRKDAVEGRLYLQRLLADVQKDLKEHADYEAYSVKVHQSILLLVAALEQKHLEPEDKEEFDFALHRFYRTSGFNSNLTTYKELVSSGKLNLIQNTDLRNTLSNYADDIEAARTVRERYAANILEHTYFVDKYVKIHPSDAAGTTYTYTLSDMAADEHLINLFRRDAMRWLNNAHSFWYLLQASNELNDLLEAELYSH